MLQRPLLPPPPPVRRRDQSGEPRPQLRRRPKRDSIRPPGVLRRRVVPLKWDPGLHAEPRAGRVLRDRSGLWGVGEEGDFRSRSVRLPPFHIEGQEDEKAK